MAMEALGRVFDISPGIAPLDLQTARTGKRVSLRHAGGVTIVIFKGAGTDGDDPVVTLNEHTASTSGTSQVLAKLTGYYMKQTVTALDGTETWTKVTQAAGSTITFNATSAQSQAIYVIELEASSLSDGFDYISLDVADTGSNAQLGGVLYFLRDLHVMRKPANLVAGLS